MDLLDGQHGSYYFDFAIDEIVFYKTLMLIQKGTQKDKVLFRSEVVGKEVFQSWIAPAKGTNGGRPFDCIIEVFHMQKALLGLVYFSLSDVPCPESDYEIACKTAKTLYRHEP